MITRAMRPDEPDLDLFRDCFARNGDRPRSMEALRWQYLDNPPRKLFVDLAVPEGEPRIAAIYATLPGFMRVGGQRRLVVQSLDTLTDADFRGRGLFVSLAKKTYARAAEQGAALVYGFPNGNSAHGFFGKLGWASLDPVPFLLRPLRVGYFAERLPGKLRALAPLLPDLPLWQRRPGPPGGHRLLRLRAFDERVTELWAEFSRDVGVAIDRDASYLKWRIAHKPEEAYEALALERNGRLEALCIHSVRSKHGGRIGYVLELMHRRGAEGLGARLLGTAVGEMAEAGADAVLAWCFDHSPNRRAFTRNAFFPLPERLRPIELHVGARSFDDSIASLVRRRASWYISYLDSDTV